MTGKQIGLMQVSMLMAVLVLACFLRVQAIQAGSPAEFQQTIPFQIGSDGYDTFRIPALVVNSAGQLVAICEGRKNSAGDSGDIDTVSKISEDGGKTWGKLRVIWDDGRNTCGNPCLVRDTETGIIWLLNTWNLGEDHEPQIIDQTSKDSRRVYVSNSADDGRTWSKSREITADVKAGNWTWYATGPGAGIQLARGSHKGRLVIPCDHIEAGTKRYYSHIIYSDDHGKTWNAGGTTPRDKVNECEVVELSNGDLLLNMRSYDPAKKARQVAISTDGGASWQDQRIVPELIDPVCQASIRRLSWPEHGKPGVLLFSNPASIRRERMTIRGSLDDGRTWPLSRLVNSQPSAYSCLAALPEGAIGLLYESGPQSAYQGILFARFTLEWLKAGTPE